MAQRRESVRLDLTGDFIPKMGEAAAVTALASRRLRALERATGNISSNFDAMTNSADGFNASLGRTNASATAFQSSSRSMQSSSRSMSAALRGTDSDARQAGDSINQLTGRLSLLADGLLVLGPGLVPIAAAGVAAIGGLSVAATAVAVAGGSAIVAFQGVGDAIEAINAYKLDPTAASLEKANEAMAQLGPSARQFVAEFQKVRPTLADIKRSAESGWFPGLTEAIGKLEQLAPQVEKIMFNVGQAGGFAVDSAAESLVSERWQPFLDVLAEEVPTAIGSISRIIGDVAHGLSEMLRVFAGDSGFLDWLGSVADGFDRWASSADAADGIEEIMFYVRQNGPALQELVVSLVEAAAAIVKAAAPLGGPVLVGLTAVADVVRVIADSDMATPLLAAVAALRIFNRLQAATVAMSGRFNRATAAAGGVAGAPMVRDPNAVGIGPMTASQAAFVASRNREAQRQAAAARRAQMRQYAASGGIAAAGVGLLATGAADQIGLTNTAMLALAGTMAGPWGAAAGAATGLALDFAAANNDVEAAIERTNQALSGADFGVMRTGLAETRDEIAKLRVDSAKEGGFLGAGGVLFKDNQADNAQQKLDRLEKQYRSNQEAVKALGEATGVAVGPLDDSVRSYEELANVLEVNRAAMVRIGVTQEDLARAKATQDALEANKPGELVINRSGSATPFDDMAEEVRKSGVEMDSATEKANNFRAAVEGIADANLPAAERATALGDAISALVDPALNAEAALSSQRDVLKQISELDVDGGFTVKNEIGRDNLEVTRAYTAAVKERLTTMVAAGRSEKDVAGALKRSRAQFIESGLAAGFSAREMARRANAIGLTPKLVKTTFRAIGLSEFDRNVDTLQTKLKALPRNVRSEVKASGIPTTMGQIDRLVGKYKLAEEDRDALISLSGTAAAIGDAFAVRAAIDRIKGKTVYIDTIQRVSRAANRNNVVVDNTSADGSTVPKGGRYEDKHLYLLAPGEEVISNRFGQADRHRGLLKMINAGRLADGGTARGGRSSAAYAVTADLGIGRAARELDEFGKASKKSRQAMLEEIKERREATRQRRSEFLDVTRSAGGLLTPELTGEGLAGFDLAVAAGTNDTARARRSLDIAKRRGLGGKRGSAGDKLLDLISSSGDLSLITEFASLSPAEIAARERRYGTLLSTQSGFGNAVAQDQLNTTLAELNKRLAEFARVQRNLPRNMRDGVRKGSEEGTAKGGKRNRRDRTRETASATKAGR